MRRLAASFILLALTITGLATPAEASLGNIREQALWTRTIAVNYTAATNRVSSAVDNGVTQSSARDERGNATTVGGFNFTFEFANQPRRSSAARRRPTPEAPQSPT